MTKKNKKMNPNNRYSSEQPAALVQGDDTETPIQGILPESNPYFAQWQDEWEKQVMARKPEQSYTARQDAPFSYDHIHHHHHYHHHHHLDNGAARPPGKPPMAAARERSPLTTGRDLRITNIAAPPSRHSSLRNGDSAPPVAGEQRNFDSSVPPMANVQRNHGHNISPMANEQRNFDNNVPPLSSVQRNHGHNIPPMVNEQRTFDNSVANVQRNYGHNIPSLVSEQRTFDGSRLPAAKEHMSYSIDVPPIAPRATQAEEAGENYGVSQLRGAMPLGYENVSVLTHGEEFFETEEFNL